MGSLSQENEMSPTDRAFRLTCKKCNRLFWHNNKDAEHCTKCLDDKKYIIVSDSMIALNKDLVTVQEVAKSLGMLAKANWGDQAKTKLANLGLVTDRDLSEYMKERFARHYVEDPEGDKCYDSPIIS